MFLLTMCDASRRPRGLPSWPQAGRTNRDPCVGLGAVPSAQPCYRTALRRHSDGNMPRGGPYLSRFPLQRSADHAGSPSPLASDRSRDFLEITGMQVESVGYIVCLQIRGSCLLIMVTVNFRQTTLRAISHPLLSHSPLFLVSMHKHGQTSRHFGGSHALANITKKRKR